MGLYAIGKPGQPVRLIVTMKSDADALAMRQDGEQVHTLNRIPTEPVMITADNIDVIAIPLTLDQAKAEKWIEAKAYRKSREDAGCVTAKGPIQTDAESKANINSAAADALRWKLANISTSAATVSVTAASSSWSRVWTMMDNSQVTLGADDMVAVADTVSLYLDAVHQAGVAVRSAIAACKTVEAVASVDITTGYPKS